MKKFVHLFLLLNSSFLLFSNALTDTILQGQLISVSNTIVSSGSVFELGVFSPGGTNSNTTTSYYVGVWYKSIPLRTVVWVANRDFPFTDISVAITIALDGNLVIVAGRISYKSFDSPLDTLLPGMKLRFDSRNRKIGSLSAWKSREDPSWGDFSLELDPQGTSQLFILRRSEMYWTSGEWNGTKFAMTPEMEPSSVLTYFVSNQNGSYFTYNLTDPNIACRMVMDESGQFKLLQWVGSTDGWELLWAQPRQLCNVNAYCGAYGTCDNYTLSSCECLHGFQPNSTENWNAGDLSRGCSRRTPLQCGYDIQVVNGLKDQFLPISNVQLPANPKALQVRNAVECESACFSNCSCSAYAYNGDGCSIWSGDLLNVKQLTDDNRAGKDFYLKLAGTEFLSKGSISKKWKWIIPTIAGVCFTLLTALIFCLRRRKSIEKGENLLSFDLGTSIGPSNYAVNEAGSKGKTDGKKEVDLPLFSFASVSAATDNFSHANKLGEGGFGPVYKGKLLKGYEVAVKRLSRKSGQGLEELQNEAMLIAKLQHKNLVRLLGCCIDRDEKILIYEYMPNKSLDFFLFDPINYGTLNWESRVNIIEGIAQGLLYLHQYSRLRIIHRDLKASNILLDKDMNPKISDFGLARIFRGNGSQATSRIVGTYGYMSPEYALEGLFSVKSDVFSFGVLLLEILSGKKNTGFYNTDSLNLLGYTWDLWKSDRGQEIKDPILEDISSINMLLRYINIGLLCVQECADDRPDMPNVLSMLSNESMLLHSPKQPAFSTSRSLPDGNSSRRLQTCSANGMTDSILEAR